MSSVSEMKDLVKLAAEPTVPGEGKARFIERAARRLGLSFRRAKAFVYEEARRVEADEWRTARAEAVHIIERMERRIEALRSIDPDFYEHEITHCRRAIDGVRHLLEGED